MSGGGKMSKPCKLLDLDLADELRRVAEDMPTIYGFDVANEAADRIEELFYELKDALE